MNDPPILEGHIGIINAEYTKFGGKIDVKGFGIVLIGKKQVDDALKYINTDGERAAFMVLPKVIKKGKLYREETNHKDRKYDTVTFAAPVIINGIRGNVGVVVKQTKGNRYKTHRILTPDGSTFVFEYKKTEVTTDGMTNSNAIGEGPSITSVDSTIPYNGNESNGKIKKSLKDNNGNELSEAQQKYFKYSKVRDENGNLKVVYHGTNKAGFTVFNRTNNFYTDSKDVADTYTNRDGIYEGYLNITKPLEIDVNGERWSRIDVEQIPYEVRVLFDEYGISTFEEYGAERTSTADIVSAVEDGIDEGVLDYDGIIFKNIYDEGMYGNAEPGTYKSDVYVTFSSNQFKNIDVERPADSGGSYRSLFCTKKAPCVCGVLSV